MDAADQTPALRILVLVDRDWTHPQTGGNGVSLIGQVGRWAEWGHHVTVVCGEHPGAPAHETFGPNLEVHRMGTRTTVFPRAILAVMRGLGRDADVVLEIVNGITWLTPLWLTKPRVVQILHVHRGIWEREYPGTGLVLHQLLEVLPLRLLYRRARFMTISGVAAEEIAALGLPRERIDVRYCGVDPEPYHHFPRAPEPRLVFVGRLKAYKGVERVMDILDAVPGATLDVVGDGDHLPDLEQEVVRRRLGDRVRFHGYVDDAEKARLYGEAWVNVTASNSEGWSLTVIEAALCGTPSAALAVGGLKESIVPGETGLLADTPEELVRVVAALLADPEERQRLGEAAERRAKTFTWEATAAANLATLELEAAEGRHARIGSRPRGAGRRGGLAVLATVALALLTVLGARAR
jgi:glycosyltransferase involved in cell wall biosynthesis